MKKNRRNFIKTSGIVGLGLGLMNSLVSCSECRKKGMKFGLVTYQWGKDWDLATLIKNCEDTGYEAVELRTEHAHGVEINLNATQRAEVKKRFANSSITNVGYGSNFEYHSPDRSVLQSNIEGTKEYIKLCHDIGATGIKVKPNNLPPEVPDEKTIAQIAASLNEVGKFANDYGQIVRVEAHGRRTQELPNMKAIFDQVTESNVKICWNSNTVDTNPPGLTENFNMVKQWFGDTVHVHSLNKNDYPYQELFKLLDGINYTGWILLEDGNVPEDIIAAMKEQKSYFDNLISAI